MIARLTVDSMQEFSLQAPQQPRKATRNISIPATITTIDPPFMLLSNTSPTSPDQEVMVTPSHMTTPPRIW